MLRFGTLVLFMYSFCAVIGTNSFGVICKHELSCWKTGCGLSVVYWFLGAHMCAKSFFFFGWGVVSPNPSMIRTKLTLTSLNEC